MDAFRDLLHQASLANNNTALTSTNNPRSTNLTSQIPMTQTMNSINSNVAVGTVHSMTSTMQNNSPHIRTQSCLQSLHIPPQESLDSPSSANSGMSDKFQNTKKRKSSDIHEERYDEIEDPKAKRRAQIAKAARKHRQRQKDELIALRAKVKDLKEQIEILQSSEPSEHNTELGWKKEAEQHAEIRARLDQENDFLRRTLTEQMKFIQRLQDYFTKQPLLNMPSLEMILNSSSSSAHSFLRSSPLSENSSTTFRNTLLTYAAEAMADVRRRIQQCNASFQTPKNPTMTYFGIEVQYETSKDDLFIFFRHYLKNMEPRVMADHLWSSYGNSVFESKFPFVDTTEVLEEIDSNTKYVRRVLILTISGEISATQTSFKEERLSIQQKRMNADDSVDFISRNVLEDPTHNLSSHHIRRSGTTTISLKKYSDTTGAGCLLLWSTHVAMKKFEQDEKAKLANHPDVVLKNLFEIIPVFVKSIVDKARSNASTI